VSLRGLLYTLSILFSDSVSNSSGPEDETKRSDMRLYHANDIASELGFTSDDYVFMALLAGGDYSVGCIPKVM
jgi:hypothetical protein